MKKLLPILFLLLGLAGGVAAGLVLGPAPAKTASDEEEPPAAQSEHSKKPAKTEKDSGASEYIKLSKHFVVPLVKHDRISGMVTLGLSLETEPGLGEDFYEIEPKLRATFLEVLFDHANMGGFEGAFTRPGNLETLRTALLEAAHRDLGDGVREVLIVDIARQDG
ncbi:flagellar basal body-associated FliL family protein [Lutimaribacter marinistellae]|uniref:Flagellar basal body-associated FliL family protein n=1 Tax=Lutimaribacter marinistellae TaxID=1820329 RepID=A0ABV7TFS4_9RHOB